MDDHSCVRLLQTVLPEMQMRWEGMRRVHKQACRRIDQRLHQLQLGDPDAYLNYLAHHPEEWRELRASCRITVTRFYRDKLVFGVLAEKILPQIARRQRLTHDARLRIISLGCASGEEPYTLSLVWYRCLQADYPEIEVTIRALDIDPTLLARAARACYPWSSIRNLPDAWQQECFYRRGEEYCLKAEYKSGIDFREADILGAGIEGQYQLILCRNLVFTYFVEEVQKRFLITLAEHLTPAGFLLVGIHETLPDNDSFKPVNSRLGIYRKR